MIDFGIGSPQAALVVNCLAYLDNLKSVIMLGMCGGIDDILEEGNFLVASAAIRGEGTSRHLLGLLARRIFVDRVRYISAPSDHLILILLILIGLSGLTMSFIAHTDVVAVKQFFIGLMTFNWSPLPADFFLAVHLLLVAFLMMIFPYSKLLHAPGVFFSPTRNQADNPREKRHIAAWARKLEEQ